jgi:hypothetical protein
MKTSELMNGWPFLSEKDRLPRSTGEKQSKQDENKYYDECAVFIFALSARSRIIFNGNRRADSARRHHSRECTSPFGNNQETCVSILGSPRALDPSLKTA